MHHSYAIAPRREYGAVKLGAALDFQSPAVRQAALRAAAELDRLGIRYAIAGGIAVAAHGHVRVTDDVDFLVGEEAFERRPGGLVTFRAGVPIHVAGVRIDYLSPENLGDHIVSALERPVLSDGLPVVPLDALVYMKLVARRLKDQADIAELIKAGADMEPVRNYLAAHAADLLPLFERVAAQADAEG